MKAIVTALLILLSLSTRSQEIKRMKIGELESYIKERATPVVVNFWATWCGPCVEEMPWFNRILNARENQNIEFVLVSLDSKSAYPDKISSFLKRRNIKATFVWLDETDADVFCPRVDHNWGGTIPATLFVNNNTGYRKFHETQMPASQLKKEIAALKR